MAIYGCVVGQGYKALSEEVLEGVGPLMVQAEWAVLRPQLVTTSKSKGQEAPPLPSSADMQAGKPKTQ